jgi:gluconolactonase
MTWNFETLEPAYGGITEGPVWDGSGLIYTHINESRILRFDPAACRIGVYREKTSCANGLALDRERRLCACQGGLGAGDRAVVRYEPDGSVRVLASGFEGKRLNIPNDLVVDREDAVWFSDPFYESSAGPWSKDRSEKDLDHDSIFRLDPREEGEWAITRVTFDTTRPNGLLFSLDFRTLYVAQSGREPEEKRQLRAYPVKADRTLGEGVVLHDFGANRGIDGMRLDAEGNIVAAAGWELGGPGPMMYVFSPSGEVLAMHPVPCRRPTNCAFGGPDLSVLYVTTIEGMLLRAQTELAGRALPPG